VDRVIYHHPPRFLLFGFGSIGKRHARNLRRLGAGEIIVFDALEERRQEAAKEAGIMVVESLAEGWQRQPEAVIVAAPTSLHVRLALEAVRQGCHLFIEKPLADRWEEVGALLDLLHAQSRVTLVGCNMRFHPGLAAVKKLLDECAVGRIIAARVEVGHYLPDWHPWEDYRRGYSARKELGGGVILDAIHEIDYIRWLLGEVATVACLAGKFSRLQIDTEDAAAMLLRFESGAVGEIHLDYVQRAYSRTCQIIGEEGTIHWDYTAGQVRWYSAQTKAWQVFANPTDWEPNQMYIDELRHFLRCLAGEESPALDVFEAARVLQVALAAKTAAKEQRWVDLGSQHWNPAATL
jgi:predicted dehydrogenase